ncbi:MAG: ABC transporter substrate-binding protein [Gemmatimonadales bacterium]|nr:ABC transporter substrate-binding protein [Gemmatimonadales bacterium]MBP9200121.1 ABC transporter substrate-binding protein [Gemmatimonadales bacterium]
MLRRALALLPLLLAACAPDATRRGSTVLFASGADLQSINPLFTVHPLARQVQRYVLLTTLVRRDSSLAIEPYLARRWAWSEGGRRLTLFLPGAPRWHDGRPTTAADAAWTLERARDPAIAYPRRTDLATLVAATAPDDTTLVLQFSAAPGTIPDVLTDLAILPRHLLDTVPPARLRQAAWQEAPVGNGPFRFVAHEPNRRWVFARNPDFPAALGGPPVLTRLVLAVVDEPMTKLAALTSGELDFAGIQPAHAAFVARDPALAVRDYPLLLTTGIVFNARRAPFAAAAARHIVSAALDRAALVDGFTYGYGSAATGPLPPELAPAPVAPPSAPAGMASSLAFELLTVGSGEAALEQMIQAQLAARGITARIRQLDLSTYLDRVYGARHDFDAAVVGTTGDLGLGYLQPLAALSGLDAPTDTAALLRLFREAAPVAFIYHARGLQGVNRRVRGVELGLRGELASVTRWSVAP